MKANVLTESGRFVVGCNYWASHAGTAMWRDWRPEVVAADMKQLAAQGLQVLRVFPLWPDFQPLHQLYGVRMRTMDLRFGEKPLPASEAGRAGVSEEAMEHFRFLADQAGANGLQLIVGLVTGWMSGRLFVPPAFEGLNVLRDPLAIQWQVRFVRYFVKSFCDHPGIVAWDLGNECNCLAQLETREQAWVWTSTISTAIRVEDAKRPVVSGMHSLQAGEKSVWHMQDQGELTDLLTTHPYPIFTPYCDQDPINAIRNGLHATAESRLYADIGGAPCLAEEMGTLGPMICSEAIAADYIRGALYSLWAHDCQGMLWWCAYDQTRLEHPPYEANAVERELGLIREDREPKPVLQEIGEFSRRLQALPFDRLPSRRRDAVCILTEGQDQWAVAYSAFILAKQAGFDLEFQTANQPLRSAELYLMPSVSGAQHSDRQFWAELLDRVAAGAMLYFSHNDCFHTPFSRPFGVEVQTRERMSVGGDIQFDCADAGCGILQGNGPFRLRLKATTANILAQEPDGNPVFTSNKLGDGHMVFLSFPLELQLARTPGAFHTDKARPWWRIYAQIAASVVEKRVARRDNVMVGLTEHELADGSLALICINYSPKLQRTTLKLAKGWEIVETLIGKCAATGIVELSANDGLVLRLKKR